MQFNINNATVELESVNEVIGSVKIDLLHIYKQYSRKANSFALLRDESESQCP